ncbi:MAG: DUF3035 domain-containing protein [Alphaproteobacteria bacterium]|nr:DUF3035 domain-containing protein [Alphaproteobacteria bacterium]
MKKLCLTVAIVAIMATSSCGWTKKKLGFTQTGPDETLVQTNDPLILPPEFNVRPKKTTPAKEEDSE